MDDKNTAEKGFKRLQRAIYEIDGLAEEGLSEIITVATLTLKWFENPDEPGYSGVMERAIKIIRNRADMLADDVRRVAECADDDFTPRFFSDENRAKEATNE
ncbi:MAG: hypothetical protein FWG75_06510 [Cystobacterineae bacterium]|nr:hypothetical protein [Cystobacterineae bacterium]